VTKKTDEKRKQWQVPIILVGMLPFLLSNASWAKPGLIAYTLITVLFGVLLVREYPPSEIRWFWKAISTIIVMHLLIVAGLVTLDFNFPEMNKLPPILYAYLGVVVLLEWRASLFLIKKLEPRI